ncbi:ferrous iron transport protein B [Desulfotomaculum arcticum]|uniref:Ferrous iron transport protein B n=1 Tax=Desulfotruncus arcticus DSM 17038 TaxID=1121424 RepID=A0A1I2QFL2_9FIRM|nr:ferrous iron transport protein B [Desulfotruncus arcticus]SFG27355.1 ferrous iron transport protein B [Desulfotomaculum arcticum] [Desulfotruncus arcticus DSM 17038]
MENLIAPEGQKRIVLVGNPNVGKSVYFHRLTGQYVDVSNFPGTTMEFYCGKLGSDFLVDTPGVYGLSGHSEEELLVRDAVLTSDMVINVVDAVHLERDLFLTCQLLDAGVPMVIALNMVDELEGRGMEVDTARMEQLLGVPVVATVAVTGQGFNRLSEKLAAARPGQADILVGQLLAGYPGIPRREAVFILEGDSEVSSHRGLEPGQDRDKIYQARQHRAGEISSAVLKEKRMDASIASTIGHWLINPLTGIPALIITLWAIYELVGVFFAQTVVGVTEIIIMKGHYEPLVRSLLNHVLDLDSPLGVILSGQFGLLTMAITYLFGLLLPLVGGFFLVLSILEDSGYLPRIATLMDRIMSYIGLNGQAVIPLVLGFGCVTMAAITTRMLASDRERRIAIFLLALSIPCSAQLAFVAAILGSLGPGYMFLYGFFILSVMAGVGTLMDRLLPGYTQPLWLDLPTMRLPRLNNILKKTWIRTFGFLKEAFPIFLGGALLLSLLKVTGLMEAIERMMQPLTTGWLYLPGETAGAFIMGFIRRDFGTAGIMAIPMEPLQKFIALVTLTLFVPCIATTLVIFKERGWREGIAIWLTVLTLAFTMGGLLAHVIYYAQGVNPAMTLPLTALFVSMLLMLAVIAARWRRGIG